MVKYFKEVKKNWLKIILVSLAGLIIWAIIRGFIFDKLITIKAPVDMLAFGESLLIQNGLFIPVIMIIATITLVLLSIAFIKIEKNLVGGKLTKGLIYGSSFFLLIFFGFIEFYYFNHSSLQDAFLSGLADGIPLFLFGILCGLVFSTGNNIKKLNSRKNLFSIFLITIFFTIGRIIFYNFFFPKQLINNISSFGFLLMLGSVFGFSYYFLSYGIKTTNPLKKSLFFFLIIGILWIPYNFFPASRFDVPLSLIVILNIIDLITITLGGFINELINKRLKK